MYYRIYRLGLCSRFFCCTLVVVIKVFGQDLSCADGFAPKTYIQLIGGIVVWVISDLQFLSLPEACEIVPFWLTWLHMDACWCIRTDGCNNCSRLLTMACCLFTIVTRGAMPIECQRFSLFQVDSMPSSSEGEQPCGSLWVPLPSESRRLAGLWGPAARKSQPSKIVQ